MRVMNTVLWAAVMAGLILSVEPATARVDVKVEFDKKFNFKAVRTWGWNPSGAGDVKMARTKDDDPDAVGKVAEPIIKDAVEQEIAKRGLKSASGTPDLTVTYYLLLSTTMTAQTMGQFLPAVSGWGLPPFAGATQSLDMMNRGSLVLDLSHQGTVVWRGLAQAKIDFDATDQHREELIREAVRDLLRKYPAK